MGAMTTEPRGIPPGLLSYNKAMDSGTTEAGKAARAAYMRKWLASVPGRTEENRKRVRRWRAENGNSTRERSREYYRKNAERIRAARKRYYANNKEKSIACSAAWAKRNAVRVAERGREYYQKTKDVYRDRLLRRTFGITLEEYKEKLKTQGGVCGICAGPSGKRIMAVDHDHKTGKVRDLLCHQCNVGLGSAKDSPDILRKMAEYIERHRKQ